MQKKVIVSWILYRRCVREQRSWTYKISIKLTKIIVMTIIKSDRLTLIKFWLVNSKLQNCTVNRFLSIKCENMVHMNSYHHMQIEKL